MKTVIHTNQVHAMTGSQFVFDLDMNRGFFSIETIGPIDAPQFVPCGSTIENIVEDYSFRGVSTSQSRHIIGNITMRG